MKRLLIGIAILLGLVGSAFGAMLYSISSGEQTADGAIFADECYLASVMVITDGTNDAKLVLYDNASAASGTVLMEITVSGSDNYGGRNWQLPVRCANGLYGDVTGTGASYIVEYIPR